MSIDFMLEDIQMMLSRNKSKDWRDSVISRSTRLMKFLQENNLLINVEPFDQQGELKLDFILMKSNVTDECLKLYKKVIPGWWGYLDKGGKVENVSRLEKGLAKIREAKK